MAGAQRADQLLIKVGNGGSPEAFTTLAGVRTKQFSLNAQQVDITNADSLDKWRELLAGAGVKSCSVTGSGVFKDAAVDETTRAEFFNQAHLTYQLVVPDFGTLEGTFQLTQLDMGGEHDGEVTWTIGLESAGRITFAAE